jgi:Cu/Ag efflux protein CusF
MKKIVVLVSLLTLVAFVFGAFAQPKPASEPAPAPAMEKFSGMIEKVDQVAKTIEVKGRVKKEHKTMTFAVDEMTKISKAKAELKLADLKKGMAAHVEYKKDGDKMTAVAIKLSAPKAAKEKAAPKEK